jgi:hypothetical protein
MRRLARQFLRLFMVAVAISASSLNGYSATLAAFDVHAHGGHGLHDHGVHSHAADHDHDHGDALDVAAAAAAQAPCCDDDPAAKGNLCTGMHAHCCCAYAVPTADLALKLGHERAPVAVAVSHIPHGQLAAPLFRPPRAIA